MSSSPPAENVTPIRPGAASAASTTSPATGPTAPPAHNLKTPPSWLSAPAKLAWRRLIPALDETYPELISTLDVPALGLMVEHLAIAQTAATEMRTKGNVPAATVVPDTAHGGTKKAPASQIMRDHGKAFLELAREYGLTLRGRASIDLEKIMGAVVPDSGDDDDLFDD